jgi:hypothetical protein
MPQALGELIIAGVGALGVEGVAGFPLASTTIGGIGITSIVGGAAILGAPIGLAGPLLPQTAALPR